MKAKKIKELMEGDYDELVVSPNDSVDDLVNMIHSADYMLKKHIDPLIHSKDDYKRARSQALKYLKKYYRLSRNEIQKLISEAEMATRAIEAKHINEAFDVLTWSRKKLPKMVADTIEETHEGDNGEDLQKSLLKVATPDELLKWYNKNFEVGPIEESLQELGDTHPWNQVYNKVKELINTGVIISEDEVEEAIAQFLEEDEYELTADDIEDAAWASWEDHK